MNVAGAAVRGVSIMYATTVGNEDATASVMMAPEADHVNISICPGVSSMIFLATLGFQSMTNPKKQTHSRPGARFSSKLSTCSNFVVKRFRAVKMPPFGPNLYLQRIVERSRKWLWLEGRRTVSLLAHSPRYLLCQYWRQKGAGSQQDQD